MASDVGNEGAERDLDQLVRRLRGFSARTWRTGDHAASVRDLLAALASLTAPGRRLPELPDHALADAVAVLGFDGLSEPATRAETAALLRATLDATR